MKKYILLLVCATLLSAIPKKENIKQDRIEELNDYWKRLSKTVAEGDFEGYKKGYHEDAVIVFASGKNKTSVSIDQALAGWKKGFEKTKRGENKSQVEFRFSQRIGNENTAHETGIFVYSTSNVDGSNKVDYPTHFEMLLVKKNGKWLGVMEYQKATATLNEWNSLMK